MDYATYKEIWDDFVMDRYEHGRIDFEDFLEAAFEEEGHLSLEETVRKVTGDNYEDLLSVLSDVKFESGVDFDDYDNWNELISEYESRRKEHKIAFEEQYKSDFILPDNDLENEYINKYPERIKDLQQEIASYYDEWDKTLEQLKRKAEIIDKNLTEWENTIGKTQEDYKSNMKLYFDMYPTEAEIENELATRMIDRFNPFDLIQTAENDNRMAQVRTTDKLDAAYDINKAFRALNITGPHKLLAMKEEVAPLIEYVNHHFRKYMDSKNTIPSVDVSLTDEELEKFKAVKKQFGPLLETYEGLKNRLIELSKVQKAGYDWFSDASEEYLKIPEAKRIQKKESALAHQKATKKMDEKLALAEKKAAVPEEKQTEEMVDKQNLPQNNVILEEEEDLEANKQEKLKEEPVAPEKKVPAEKDTPTGESNHPEENLSSMNYESNNEGNNLINGENAPLKADAEATKNKRQAIIEAFETIKDSKPFWGKSHKQEFNKMKMAVEKYSRNIDTDNFSKDDANALYSACREYLALHMTSDKGSQTIGGQGTDSGRLRKQAVVSMLECMEQGLPEFQDVVSEYTTDDGIKKSENNNDKPVKVKLNFAELQKSLSDGSKLANKKDSLEKRAYAELNRAKAQIKAKKEKDATNKAKKDTKGNVK